MSIMAVINPVFFHKNRIIGITMAAAEVFQLISGCPSRYRILLINPPALKMAFQKKAVTPDGSTSGTNSANSKPLPLRRSKSASPSESSKISGMEMPR